MGNRRRYRGNSVLDAIQAFNSAYDTVSRVGQDFEMARVGAEKPEETTGFTEAQGEQLRAAADSGQYDIGYDQEKQAYTVTPKAGGETGTIGQQQRTQFLGKTYDKPLSEGEIDRARMMAMSGIHAKYGNPEKAMQLKQMARQGELADMQLNSARQEEEYKAGIKDWMANSRYGQVQQANMTAEQEHQAAVADYEAKIKAGADPKTLGLPPQAPQKQTYGIGDSLADSASFLAYEAKFGKFDPQKWTGLAEKMQKVQDEGYERALRAAESGAPLDKIAKEFNRSGEVKFDPKDVVSDRVGKTNIRGQQIDTRLITLKDGRTINVAAELAAIGGTKEILSTHFQIKEDQRSGARLGLAQQEMTERRAERKEAKEEKKATADTAAELYRQRNPGATDAELEAVRRGVLSAVPKEVTNEYTATTDSMGLNVMRTNKNSGAIDIINPKTGEVKSIPAPGRPAAQPAQQQVARPQTEDDFKKLPKGALYVDPDDGKTYRKP